MHPRTNQSHRDGLQDPQDPLSLALQKTTKGALCRLREHMAQNQARIRWLPCLVQQPRRQSTLRQPIQK